AVSQPSFKFRNWSEQQKMESTTGGEDSPAATEGPDTSISNYVTELSRGRREEQLDRFYNGNNSLYKRHKNDAKKAKDAEYAIITDRLLNMVGGNIGRKRQPDDKVVIGIGLGKFSSDSRLSSLHTSFQEYFVQKVRSLGYVVLGINEFYTSKKCPTCHQFLCQVEIRRLHCEHCMTLVHRDVIAAENMCNIIRGYLLDQKRPRYLQPVDENKNYPWEKTAPEEIS
ncbi:hypothetical protein BGZ65_000123, partial [Modicella reniformis]